MESRQSFQSWTKDALTVLGNKNSAGDARYTTLVKVHQIKKRSAQICHPQILPSIPWLVFPPSHPDSIIIAVRSVEAMIRDGLHPNIRDGDTSLFVFEV